MGKLSILIVIAMAITFGIHSFTVSNLGNAAIENYASYNSSVVARNVNNSTMELALKQLADSALWRDGYKVTPIYQRTAKGDGTNFLPNR